MEIEIERQRGENRECQSPRDRHDGNRRESVTAVSLQRRGQRRAEQGGEREVDGERWKGEEQRPHAHRPADDSDRDAAEHGSAEGETERFVVAIVGRCGVFRICQAIRRRPPVTLPSCP